MRTARVGLCVTAGRRRRCFALLAGAGDVWAAVLDMNRWQRQRGLRPLVSYQRLCRELAAAGPGTFGELDSQGARSVLRRYSDAWFTAARRRAGGGWLVRFPRRKRRLMPVRYYHGTFTLDGRWLRLPVARGCAPLWVRLGRDVPYPAERVRSVTLVNEGGWLFVEVTAEVPLAVYPPGQAPDPGRVAGVDLGVIHPYAAAGPATGSDALPVAITHHRAGRHLPGAAPSRRDPRRRPRHGTPPGSLGQPRPAPPPSGESLAHPARIRQPPPTRQTLPDAALNGIASVRELTPRRDRCGGRGL
jgi:hypothetical protein